MKIKHLLYSIVLGSAFGLTLGVLVYTVPALAQTQGQKLATDLTEVGCHHEDAPSDCDCDSCEDGSDCEDCSECSDKTDQDSDDSKETEKAISCGDEASSCSVEG